MDINQDVRITKVKVLTSDEMANEIKRIATERNNYYVMCQDLISELHNCGMEETALYYADMLYNITNGRKE